MKAAPASEEEDRWRFRELTQEQNPTFRTYVRRGVSFSVYYPGGMAPSSYLSWWRRTGWVTQKRRWCKGGMRWAEWTVTDLAPGA